MNYYNEIDPFARKWLRQLIRDGLIPDGYIDNRPIQEVRAEEITREGFKQCHFFAGIGGWPLALRIAGVHDDEELWTGSCPCQPFSSAGDQVGFRDSRHLFPTFRRLIARCGPPIVFGEQVSSKLGREWLARVRLEMASLGYATRGGDYCSAGVAAPNRRQRLYWVADSAGSRHHGSQIAGATRDSQGEGEGEGYQPARRSELERSGAYGAVANSDRSQQRRDEPARHEPLHAEGGVVGVALGDTNTRGHEASRFAGTPPETFCAPSGQAVGTGSRGLPGFWEDSEFIRCTDGKVRRIPTKPELFPLAARLPGDLGLIRGAGNAINPWVAAKFIQDCFA
jgi:DNA (cytosine-5)-methyltransferase 1